LGGFRRWYLVCLATRAATGPRGPSDEELAQADADTCDFEEEEEALAAEAALPLGDEPWLQKGDRDFALCDPEADAREGSLGSDGWLSEGFPPSPRSSFGDSWREWSDDGWG
jgi:hypothetical protein